MKGLLPVILLFIVFCVMPAPAVVLEVTLKGTVAGLTPLNHTLTIANPARYGCSYPEGGGAPVCSYTPLENTTILAGSVPGDGAYSIFSPGDPLIATSLGGPGGRWIALAKLSGKEADATVTDIIGEPGSVPVPLAGNYRIELSTKPDCSACSGTTCTAASAGVKLMSGAMLAMAQDLTPAHTMSYNGRNDGSGISVTFLRGEASSASCAGRGVMTGIQPVSVYIIHVVPPISAATTVPATPPEVTMPPEARPTPTRSPMPPFAAAGAFALAGILFAYRRT